VSFVPSGATVPVKKVSIPIDALRCVQLMHLTAPQGGSACPPLKPSLCVSLALSSLLQGECPTSRNTLARSRLVALPWHGLLHDLSAHAGRLCVFSFRPST